MTELGSVRPTGPGLTPPTAVTKPGIILVRIDRARPGTPGRLVARRGGVGPGPSQKVDRARPGTPHGCDEARRKRVVCVWRGRAATAAAVVAGAKVSWVSNVSCLLCSRGQRLLEIGNGEQHRPLGRKRFLKNNNEVSQQRISWGTFQKQ